MSKPKSYIRDGIEFFEVENGTDAQCARCGSSVTYIEDDSLDGSGYEGHVCLSDPEWCDANPIRGREFQMGGHGRPVPRDWIAKQEAKRARERKLATFEGTSGPPEEVVELRDRATGEVRGVLVIEYGDAPPSNSEETKR